MSHQATTWVMEFSESRLADRLVLGAIAHRVSNDNGEAFPSVKTIAREANVSESSTHASLNKLKQLGELEVTVGASEYGTNVYRMPKFMAWMEGLHLPRSGGRGGTKSAPHCKRGGSNPQSLGVQNPGVQGTGSGPEPSRTVIKPSGAAPVRPPQDTKSTPLPSMEKAERQSPCKLKQLAREKSLPRYHKPVDPLRAELWDAMYFDQLENVFLDGHRLSLEERLADCMKRAVILVATGRVAKLFDVDHGRDIEMLAIEKLKPHLKALKAVPDLPMNSRSFARAVAEHVRSAVTEAAAELYESVRGDRGSENPVEAVAASC